MKRLCVIVVLLCACSALRAEGQARAVNVYDNRVFAVAGVLRKSTETIVIKLVQSVESARSAEEAIGQFTRKIQREYADYSVWDTVVTPLPRPTCEAVI